MTNKLPANSGRVMRLVLPLSAAGADIPRDVAVCPECGGRLTFNEDFDTDPDSDEPPGIDCENEPDLDDDEEDFHRFWQSDWQPVIDKIRAHYRGQNADVRRDDGKGLPL